MRDFTNKYTLTELKEAYEKALREGSEEYLRAREAVKHLGKHDAQYMVVLVQYQSLALQLNNAALSRCFELLAQKESLQ